MDRSRDRPNLLIHSPCRTFVAGHRGMAGSAICRASQRSGYGQASNAGAQLVASWAELDLPDRASGALWCCERMRSVVVLAAAKPAGIRESNCSPACFVLDTHKIQTNAIEVAWRTRARHLIALGSCCIYPKVADQPLSEGSLRLSPVESSNQCYDSARTTGIGLVQALWQRYDFDAISLMLTTSYAPGDNHHFISSHVLPIRIRRLQQSLDRHDLALFYCASATLREFMHIDNLGYPCLFALQPGNSDFIDAPCDNLSQSLTSLNLGSQLDLTIYKLGDALAAATGFIGRLQWDECKPDGTPNQPMEVTWLCLLGWQATISLQEGLVIREALENLPASEYPPCAHWEFCEPASGAARFSRVSLAL